MLSLSAILRRVIISAGLATALPAAALAAAQPGKLIGGQWSAQDGSTAAVAALARAGMIIPVNGADCVISGINGGNIWSAVQAQLTACAGQTVTATGNPNFWQVVYSAPSTTFGYAKPPTDGSTDLSAFMALTQAAGATLQAPSTSTTTTGSFSTGAAHTWAGAQTFGPTMETGRSFSGASDTPSPTDCGQPILSTGNLPVTVTLPATMPANCYLQYTQWGSGPLAFTEATSASLTAPPSFTLADRKGASVLVGVAANPGGNSAQWNIYGWSAQ